MVAALTGCGVPAAYVEHGDRGAVDRSGRDKSLDFANWPLYIDTGDDDATRRPTLDAFSERTGISVRYTEEINDNDEFFGKISPALMNHQETGRDVIVVSDWMAARFVRLDWVQEMASRSRGTSRRRRGRRLPRSGTRSWDSEEPRRPAALRFAVPGVPGVPGLASVPTQAEEYGDAVRHSESGPRQPPLRTARSASIRLVVIESTPRSTSRRMVCLVSAVQAETSMPSAWTRSVSSRLTRPKR